MGNQWRITAKRKGLKIYCKEYGIDCKFYWLNSYIRSILLYEIRQLRQTGFNPLTYFQFIKSTIKLKNAKFLIKRINHFEQEFTGIKLWDHNQ